MLSAPPNGANIPGSAAFPAIHGLHIHTCIGLRVFAYVTVRICAAGLAPNNACDLPEMPGGNSADGCGQSCNVNENGVFYTIATCLFRALGHGVKTQERRRKDSLKVR
jgi:hypothetical protein